MGFAFPDKFRDRAADVIDDWEAFAKSHEEDSPVSIRINPQKISNLPDLPRVPWNPNGHYLQERPHFTMDPLFHAGVYYPQEPGSMLLDHVLRQLTVDKENIRVLDLCAAPGGKSTLILDWLDGNGFLVSNEVIGKRARVLQENLDKWGRANRLVSNSDPKHFRKLGKVFDVIVIDAPCSGEGMFRKETDASKMWSEDLVEHCYQRQRRIVNDALECLKPGGFLIYSTCTYNTRENEEVLAPLLVEYGAASIQIDIPAAWGISESQRAGIAGYRCLPHRVSSEGFFISVVGFPGEIQKTIKKRNGKKQSSKPFRIPDPVRSWIAQPDRFGAIVHNNQTFLLPVDVAAWALEVSAAIHVLTIGVEVGRIIRDELVPAPPLALSVDLKKDTLASFELSDLQVIRYLHKHDLLNEVGRNGWTLCTYRETPIGWAKTVDGKLKNHWPKEWRILRANQTIAQAVLKP